MWFYYRGGFRVHEATSAKYYPYILETSKNFLVLGLVGRPGTKKSCGRRFLNFGGLYVFFAVYIFDKPHVYVPHAPSQASCPCARYIVRKNGDVISAAAPWH